MKLLQNMIEGSLKENIEKRSKTEILAKIAK
jgi:hypothetical protein